MADLKVTVTSEGATKVAHLAGVLNEHAGEKLKALEKADGNSWRFVFKQVVNVNSSGLRAWLIFLKNFATGRSIDYAECHTSVVSMFNMVPAVVKGCTVSSIHVRLTCNACAHEDTVLIAADEFPSPGTRLAARACAICGATSASVDEFDDPFEFLER